MNEERLGGLPAATALDSMRIKHGVADMGMFVRDSESAGGVLGPITTGNPEVPAAKVVRFQIR